MYIVQHGHTELEWTGAQPGQQSAIVSGVQAQTGATEAADGSHRFRKTVRMWIALHGRALHGRCLPPLQLSLVILA
jgi:hypothetical protein